MKATQIEKRRARNRVSQKSFRERQTLYVRQLESQLAEKSHSESERIQVVIEERESLRRALLAARKRILGLTTALSGVSDNIGTALGLEGRSLATQSDEERRDSSPGTPSEVVNGSANRSKMSTSVAQMAINDPLNDSTSSIEPPSEGFSHHTFASETPNAGEMNTQNTLQSLSWPIDVGLSLDLDFASAPSYRLDLGHNAGQAGTICTNLNVASGCLDASRGLQSAEPQTVAPHLNSLVSNGRLHEGRKIADIRISFPPGNPCFPSQFCAHLAACEYFVKQNKAYRQRGSPGGSEALSKLISNMVNMFVNTAWPDMRVWWAYVQAIPSVERILRWRLDPCLESYTALRPCHRPTTAQLCTIHPTIIDWICFPSVRDRIIELYLYSPALDQLICEILCSYVVEADLSNLITGLDSGLPKKGYFRIWDLVQTISNEELDNGGTPMPNEMSFWQDMSIPDGPPSPFQFDDEDEEEEAWTPMPLEDIFYSKKAALKLFKTLHMDERDYVKLDPMFAMNHPELCDDPSILARGVDCTVKRKSVDVPLPKPLTRETILNYKMMLWKATVT